VKFTTENQSSTKQTNKNSTNKLYKGGVITGKAQ
jgi:hypothetical protein